LLNHDGVAENNNAAVVEDDVAVKTIEHVERVGQDAVTEGAIAPPTSEEAASTTAMVAEVATSASLEPNGV
jgi:hypothetical protein